LKLTFQKTKVTKFQSKTHYITSQSKSQAKDTMIRKRSSQDKFLKIKEDTFFSKYHVGISHLTIELSAKKEREKVE